MQIPALGQRTVLEDASRIALRLPLGKILGAFHPGGFFALAEDPRRTPHAVIAGMMVLRPADSRWQPPSESSDIATSLGSVRDWCFDVEGIGGSWPISAGSVLDAYRLALQYGVVDAVLAGAATVAREGLVAGARPGHLWQPYTPLGWAALKPHREILEPAIAALRRDWQQLGVLSDRRYPAQVAITASGRVADGAPDLLDARMFHDRHPDGSAMESYLLTSERGAERLRERARTKGRSIDDAMLVAAMAGDPEAIDVARVPSLLRSRLDARLVEHDGGRATLEAFASAGAINQLNVTLLGRRSVRDVVESTTRLDEPKRSELLQTWQGRARLFPSNGSLLTDRWKPVYAIAEDQPSGEGLVATLVPRS